MNQKKWDIKQGYGVYKSVYTEILKKWIKQGSIKEGAAFVWASGMSGWRRPEELPEFAYYFEKIRSKAKRKVKAKTKAKKSAQAISVSSEEKPRKYLEILIVDDEKDMCWLLENALKEIHYKVTSVNSGREAFDSIKLEEPDIVLLDLRLKDVDGLNVLRKIKELWPKIKIIIISAFAGQAIKEKAQKLGAVGFVDKPFKVEDVVKAIKKLD